MPKKGKVNKLARMSDEERARYLQHRADLEEEARRRKQELIARFIKNKLDKEEAFSRKNTAKVNQIWRFILRRIKCKQMMIDIQGIISSFNYMMDRKQRLVATLMVAIDDSDDQHRRAFQAHTETISDFLDLGRQRLDKVHDEYERQKNILLESWDKQELQIGDNQDQAEFKLKLITYIQDHDFKNYKNVTEIENATVKNDARLEHEEEMRALQAPKELEIEMYWTRLREVFTGYVDQHRPIMGHYQLLREKDEYYQRDIERNERLIHNASKIVQTLQKEYANTTNNINSKIKRMSDRKEDLSKNYLQMKKDYKIDRNKSEEQLIVLVDASREVIQQMEQARQKLTKIQNLSAICSKYEKDSDSRVLNDPDENDRADTYENLDEDMIKECKQYKKLDKFMLKINHIKVQVLCLQAEKRKLAKENDGLKLYIKKYLTELALKTDKRPMSVKVHSDYKLERIIMNRPVTCIEGAVCNAVLHEKRMKVFQKRAKKNQIRSYPRLQNWM